MNLELLTKLTQTFGPSGYEEEIREVLRAEVVAFADEVRVDPLGSLVVRRRGKEGGKKILLAAHMDEIGLMATYVDEKGFVRFTSIGGVRPTNCVGGRARFADGTLGAIAVEWREDATTTPALEHLYLDVGATGREDCPVKVGDPAVFVGPLEARGRRLISKALDDRIGCYVLLEVLRQLPETPHDIYFVFSTQEEITLAGARTTAFRIDPDMAIAVDVTVTGDTPKSLPMDVALGKGPAIKVKDRGMIAHPLVRDLLVAAAEKAASPYQMEILLYGSTDASAMQLVRAGVPSGCLSVPSRFVHSPSEMVDGDDVENSVRVLLAALPLA
ncbi:MAG TPA: M42 family metallopeptidase [Anaerolineae bacterium]|nr:M42 family metallopeptidase [Anaerolineae bacterium]